MLNCTPKDTEVFVQLNVVRYIVIKLPAAINIAIGSAAKFVKKYLKINYSNFFYVDIKNVQFIFICILFSFDY